MVSDSRLQDLFEGIVDSSPHPAVDVNALYSEPDPLVREVLILQETKKRGHHKVKRVMKKSPPAKTNMSKPSSVTFKLLAKLFLNELEL